jgi:hypothetical protein
LGGTNGTGGGTPYSGNGGIGAVAQGGALYNAGIATIWNCTFMDNFSQAGNSQAAQQPNGSGNGGAGPAGPGGFGGAIYNVGTNSIVNSTFFLNLASGGSGGNGGNSSSLVAGNGGNGGNGVGGSVCNAGSGSIHITNCTFAGGATYGGTNGLAGTGPFAGNNGSPGGSYGANIGNTAGTLSLKNSILAYPTNAANAYNAGTFVDQNNNLSSDTTPVFTQTNSFRSRDPKLGALSFNGGSTETMALAPTSPAVNAIYDGSAPAFDQRGYPRPLGIRPCIGAYEYGIVYSVSGQLTVGRQLLGGVTVRAGNISAVTDTNGEFLFSLPAGTYSISPQPPALFKVPVISRTVPPGAANVNFVATTNTTATITNSAGALLATFTGFPYINYAIQASTNVLYSTNWQTLTTNNLATNGIFTFSDSGTNYAQRFYRAVAQ